MLHIFSVYKLESKVVFKGFELPIKII